MLSLFESYTMFIALFFRYDKNIFFILEYFKNTKNINNKSKIRITSYPERTTIYMWVHHLSLWRLKL